MNEQTFDQTREIYLDYNATTPVREEVLVLMEEVLREGFGNPSSVHSSGRRARRILDEAREKLASTLGSRAADIVFTSGGTESDNLAIKGLAAKRGRGHIITSAVEHPAVLETCRSLEAAGFEVTYLPVDKNGLVDTAFLRSRIREDTFLVSVMWANNETGVIQPVDEIAKITGEKGVVFHSDAVQAYSRLPIDVTRTAVDLLSVSGHKLCAPKGTGALYVRPGIEIDPVLHGGGQEWRRRSGTENIPGAAALGEAGRLACGELESEAARQEKLRDRLERGILEAVPGAFVNGGAVARIPNTTNIRFEGADGEAAVLSLDARNIAASSSSACAASYAEPSHVLLAMGLSRREADSSVRFSLGRFTGEEDVDVSLEVLPGIIERIRSVTRR